MKRFYLLLLGLFVVLGYSNAALAFDLFKPSDNDWIVKNIMNTLFNPEKSPFSAISGVFLSGVLAFGGVLAGYTLLVGTMSTAHDGEMLGKRWSTMWLPIRTTLGVAMILPIKNGFCAIQIIVVWLATQGIGLADQTWTAFVNEPLLGTSNYAGPVLTPGLQKAFSESVAMTNCLLSVREHEQKLKSEGKSGELFSGGEADFTIVPPSQTGGTQFQYGSATNSNFTSYCGAVVIEQKKDSRKGYIPTVTDVPKAATILVDGDAVREILYTAQQAAFVKLITAANNTGANIFKDPNYSDDKVKADMNKAVSEFVTSIETTAMSSYKNMVNIDVKNAMIEDGFSSAGSWFMKIIKAQDLVNYEINNVPKAKALNLGSGYYEVLNPNYKDIGYNAYTATINRMNNVTSSVKVGVNNKNITTATKDDFLMQVLDSLVNQDNVFNPGTDLNNPTEHPIVLAMTIGNKIIRALVVALGTLAGAAMGGGLIPFVGNGIAAMASLLGSFVSSIALTILIPALYLSVYVPLMPFIIWTGTMIGWLILVVEALFASPLWAMAHLAPDGDGVVGQQGQGYMMILSLVLRPVLMVIGFVVSISLMVPAGQFINYFFSFAISGTGSDSITQGFVSIGSCFIYCIIIHNLMNKMLGLIHELPDSILEWIGGRGGKVLGQYGDGLEQQSNGKSNAMLNQGIASVTRGGAGMKQKYEQLKQNAKDKKAADEKAKLPHGGGMNSDPNGGGTPPTK